MKEKFKDIPLMYGLKLKHHSFIQNYPSGKAALFYNLKIFKGRKLIEELEYNITRQGKGTNNDKY